MGLVFKWIERNGGVEGMLELVRKKSAMIYDIIDKSGDFYTCPIKVDARSKMNVPFKIRNGDEQLEKEFLSGAEARGMKQLKGHRSVKNKTYRFNRKNTLHSCFFENETNVLSKNM